MRALRGSDFLVLLIVAGAVPSAHAQTQGGPDSTVAGKYSIVAQFGGGLAWSPSPVDVPVHLTTTAYDRAPMGSARLMWQPDHRLRVGFETGWLRFSGYDIEGPGVAGRVRVKAVPLLMMWSMSLSKRFTIYAGYGTYRLISELDYAGTARAGTFSLGYAAALAYTQPLGKRVGLSLEGEWMNAAETRHTMLCFQTRVVWNLLRW